MTINIEKLLEDIFSNLLVGALEKSALVFTQSERRKGGVFLRKLNNSKSDMIVTLNKPIYRRAFLYGCSTFYYYLSVPNEWLIVGLGETLGKKTKINRFYMRQGTASGVNIPLSIIENISNLIETSPNSDVIFVHNHPSRPLRWLKNFILGNNPITSTHDRNYAWQHRIETVFGLLGKRRFYLIENDLVKEFYLPSLKDIASVFNRKSNDLEEMVKRSVNRILLNLQKRGL